MSRAPLSGIAVDFLLFLIVAAVVNQITAHGAALNQWQLSSRAILPWALGALFFALIRQVLAGGRRR